MRTEFSYAVKDSLQKDRSSLCVIHGKNTKGDARQICLGDEVPSDRRSQQCMQAGGDAAWYPCEGEGPACRWREVVCYFLDQPSESTQPREKPTSSLAIAPSTPSPVKPVAICIEGIYLDSWTCHAKCGLTGTCTPIPSALCATCPATYSCICPK